MDQGPDQEQGIHVHLMKIKSLEISFDHSQSCMPTSKLSQSWGTVQTRTGKSPVFHPQHIPPCSAANIQDMCTKSKVPDQMEQKRRGIYAKSLVKIGLSLVLVEDF
jgi:hypothetical protein